MKPGEAVGRSARELYRDHPQILADLERTLAGEDVTDTLALGDLACEVHYTPLRDKDGQVIGAVGVAADVAERRRTERDLERLARYDPLTGLPNRTLFRDRLDHAVLRSRRAATPCALLLLDLDRFKEVNNTFGHRAGDELLRRVGQTLCEVLRKSDIIARFGGDEFAILLHGADAASATRLARRLRKALERPFAVEEHAVDIAASMGVAAYPEHGEDSEILLRHAEIAMYAAKSAHAGHAVYAPSQDEYSPDRLSLVPQLREAIRTDGLLLHYQPVVRIAEGKPLALEALVRWPHPEQGLIAPARFIPLAERTGLMKPLTDWVLAAALRQCAAWRDAGYAPAVSVNISMRNLLDPEFAGSVAGVLHVHGVEASQLRLEITESVIMADPERAIGTLARLHKLGARIDIDDFGTGYSSLAYLHRFPVDAVKIDRSFVSTMRSDEGSATIVRSIIGLGHDLGLEVIAEGVEDRDTAERLAELGCDALQGYYLMKPAPAAELARWLETVR
ncbi:MAG TPA: EAL domain-containing protein [Candidatus Limnocylindria bacterium]|nr:EAL domain-containing protein [Candidatus Limnocylindria bacterium]